MCDKNDIVNTLTKITKGLNDEVKLAAIQTLGDYKATLENEASLGRLIELCQDNNKDVAVASIQALAKLARYF
ncbi:HEAT repeat domain-containing protein [Providencia rettgeri]|nr:HEAT repeat domain-containing protein [Providencia rettgeri]